MSVFFSRMRIGYFHPSQYHPVQVRAIIFHLVRYLLCLLGDVVGSSATIASQSQNNMNDIKNIILYGRGQSESPWDL